MLSMHGLLPNTRISQLIGHFDWRQNRPSLIRSKTNIEHKLKRKKNEREKKSKASTAAELCVAGGPLPSTCGHQHSDPSLPGAATMASGLPGSLSTADGDATRLDGSAWPPPSHAKSGPDGDMPFSSQVKRNAL